MELLAAAPQEFTDHREVPGLIEAAFAEVLGLPLSAVVVNGTESTSAGRVVVQLEIRTGQALTQEGLSGQEPALQQSLVDLLASAEGIPQRLAVLAIVEVGLGAAPASGAASTTSTTIPPPLPGAGAAGLPVAAIVAGTSSAGALALLLGALAQWQRRRRLQNPAANVDVPEEIAKSPPFSSLLVMEPSNALHYDGDFEAVISLKMTHCAAGCEHSDPVHCQGDNTIEMADALFTFMEEEGISTFVASRNLEFGDPDTSICQQIAAGSRLVIALVCKDYAAKTASHMSSLQEARLLWDRLKRKDGLKVIWVRLDEEVRSPWALANLGAACQHVVHVDARGWRAEPGRVPKELIWAIMKWKELTRPRPFKISL